MILIFQLPIVFSFSLATTAKNQNKIGRRFAIPSTITRVSTKLKMLTDLTSLTMNIRAWEKYCVIKASVYKFRANLT